MPILSFRRLRLWLGLTLVLLLVAAPVPSFARAAAPAPAMAAPADDLGEALREAAEAGDLARIDALLASGVPVDAPARHGHTPLYYAALEGHLAAARRLVERGADVNARERFFGWTPLSIALQGGHLELARFLLAAGAEEAGEALETAVERGDLELARTALATGFVEPLDLAAARRALQGDESVPPALRELLAAAAVKPRQRPPYKVAPDRLAAYAGRYRTGEGKEVTVAVRGEGLGLTFGGEEETPLAPVIEDRFDRADGGLSVAFYGRGGLVDWMRVNRGGEVLRLGAVTADAAPLRTAAASAADQAAGSEGAAAAPQPWPQFRGPRASGVGEGQGAPASWNVETGAGVRWKTPIPGIGLSSPVVWGDRIFLTTAVSGKGATVRAGHDAGTSVDDTSEQSFRVFALDAGSGKVVWEREVHRGVPPVSRHLKSSFANASPATDGERVVVLFGPIGKLAAYDFAGQQLWVRDVGILDCNDPQSGAAEWGHASSPVLYQGLVLIQGDRRKDSFLAAYRLATGEEVWRVARAEPSTWATPNLLSDASGAGGDELVVNGSTIRGYDPQTGKELWRLGPSSEVVIASPVVGDGLAFVAAGYPPVRPVFAIRPGQRGDLSLPAGQRASAAIAWSHARGGPHIPTPLLYRGLLHTCNNNGIFTTYRAATGEQLSQIRLSQAGASFSASPVAADGRLYVASETGEVYVLRAAPEPELLATVPMGEPVMSTPAISGGQMVLRTLGHVYGLGSPAAAPAGAQPPGL